MQASAHRVGLEAQADQVRGLKKVTSLLASQRHSLILEYLRYF
jgi:hypothetical protein